MYFSPSELQGASPFHIDNWSDPCYSRSMAGFFTAKAEVQPTQCHQLPAGRTDSVLEAGAPAPSASELHNKKRLVSPPFVLVRALTALGVAPKNRVYMLDVGVLELLLEVMAGDQPDLALGAAQVGLRGYCLMVCPVEAA